VPFEHPEVMANGPVVEVELQGQLVGVVRVLPEQLEDA
jgi:hypothetical protein